jgi:multiple sugar transport system substrate-binding protein
VVSNAQIANVYQGFARGDFAMYVTGPWNIGEFRRRLPPEMEGKWGTAPLPAPAPREPPGTSLAGGSSLVLFRTSPRKAAAWKLVEYLSRPEQQLRFYELSGDLPAVEAAWELPPLAEDPLARAFRVQLGEVAPTPRVAEWEQIATAIFEHAERAIRGRATTEEALRALDAQVDEILEKRRWVLARREEAAE